MADILSFIQSYVPVSPAVASVITASFTAKKLRKNALLFPAGTVCQEFVFITQGCLRFFYTPQETEITVWISFPGTVGSEIQSFISGRPGKFQVQAISPVEYISISKANFEQLRQNLPEFNRFYLKLCEETIVDVIDRLIAFQFQSAEQRYLALMQQPDYLKLIPQKYLASYLGITPTSLSRLRKKLAAA